MDASDRRWRESRVAASRYALSEHVIRYLMAGKVTVRDIEAVLCRGVILEAHLHTSRGMSYLGCGVSGGRPIHVMWADGRDGWLVVTFAYVACLPIWSEPTRRKDRGGRDMAITLATCYFCGGGLKEITVGNFDYRLEGELYVIKRVPAALCDQCGEKFIEAEVGRRMNALIEKKSFTGTESVGVIDYDEDAPH